MIEATTMPNQAANAQDSAMVAHADSVASGKVQAVTSSPQQLQSSIQLEPTKRNKTWGERLFDITTYGGFALVGNELTATAIVEQAEKPNLMGRAIRAGQKFFEGRGVKGELPYLQKRFNYISFAILGGFVMVPFIKKLEDNKGRLVRFADNIIYGNRAKTDQDIVKKHEEMDNAPNQTWGSLGKGRALTVAAAYAVDATINWKDGFSAKLLRGTRFENHASLEHVSDSVAEWANKQLTNVRKITPEASLAQKGLLKNLFGLGTLSATLTALFYVSSKIFAKKRDERIEQRHHAGSARTNDRDEAACASNTPLATLAEQPSVQVSNICHEATIAKQSQQLAPSH